MRVGLRPCRGWFVVIVFVVFVGGGGCGGGGVNECVASGSVLLLLLFCCMFVNKFFSLLEGHFACCLGGGFGVGGTGRTVEVKGVEGRGNLSDVELVHMGEGRVQRELVQVGLELANIDSRKDDCEVK